MEHLAARADQEVVSLRQYVESLIAESSKRTDVQFLAAKEAVAAALAAAEKAVSAALVAQDKQTSAAFIAAKEALAEAQTQLTLYKSQSNEWRSTLSDLIAKVMMRPEIVALFTTVEHAIEEIKTRLGELEGRGERSAGRIEGKDQSSEETKWNFSQTILIASILIGWGLSVVFFLIRGK